MLIFLKMMYTFHELIGEGTEIHVNIDWRNRNEVKRFILFCI